MYQGPEPRDVFEGSRTAVSAASLGTIRNVPGCSEASCAVITALGRASLIVTVLSSGFVTETMGASGLTEFANSARRVLMRDIRSQENTTSLASTLRPLVGGRGAKWQLPFNLRVSVSLSGETSHDSATSPSSSPAVRCKW